jgi:hypothetical protein
MADAPKPAAPAAPKGMSPWGWVALIAIGVLILGSFAFVMFAQNLSIGATAMYAARTAIGFVQRFFGMIILTGLIVYWIISGINKK